MPETVIAVRARLVDHDSTSCPRKHLTTLNWCDTWSNIR